MRITFDEAKRARTLEERDLDFVEAVEVFAGPRLTIEDRRKDYGEVRYLTLGLLRGRVVMVVWTPRNSARHVISMRKANAREQTVYKKAIAQKTLD